jgi:hypothetical protein
VLKNVGVTDVPWIAKFAAPGPPYNNDQHPFLIWNMYRVSNGRLEQIGASGAKHAFLTLNTNCGCPSGNTLWVNCEDTYSVGTNNASGSISPRTEITAHTGVWARCGSIFDRNCDGIQDSVPGFTGAADSRRMGVAEPDLQVAGAQYFADGWYVVRDDTNIYNTMAYRPVTPSFNGTTWTFGLGTQALGAVADAWVNPLNPGANADNQKFASHEGHLTLAVRATDLGGGRWRYNYALTNHDYDDGIVSFSVAVPLGATVTNTYFHDPDRDAKNDWVAVASPGMLSFQPPKSPMTPAAFAMDWGLLYTFSFEVDAAPTSVRGTSVYLGTAGLARSVPMAVLGPSK